MCRSFCFAICLSCVVLPTLAKTTLLLAPSLRTEGTPVSDPLDASFAGFGIESTNLFAFAGKERPNEFSLQLLRNLAEYAGAPPHIRLGGNTQDYMIYDENWEYFAWKWNDQSVAQGTVSQDGRKYAADSIIFGPAFFEALERFPKGTPVTYGLNLAYSEPDYLDRIIAAAAVAVDRMRNVQLYSFEIGNEVDLYLQNEMRSGRWDGHLYTQQFFERAEAVYEGVLKPAGLPSTMFESPATASTIGNTFEIAQLVQDGLINEYNGRKYMSCWNQHDYFYFHGVTAGPITIDKLLDLDATNKQFAYWEKQVGIALKTGIPYALREMSSVGPTGEQGISDTFAAALWTLNFFLFAATLDISSVQMHMTENSFAAAWQPIHMDGKAPLVRPQYYAHVAMAQIVGSGNGTTQIGVLNTNDVDSGYKGRIRAYAAYALGELTSVILINSKPAYASTDPKAAFMFQLDLGEEHANKEIYMSYLTAAGADSLTGATFNGKSFSDKTGREQAADNAVYISETSDTGSVSIALRDTEAVVAKIGKLLGTDPVTTDTQGFVPVPKVPKNHSAAGGSSRSGASTAAWTGALTTTLALASSATSGAPAKETAASKISENEAVVEKKVTRNVMVLTLSVVVLGFFCMV